MKFSDSAQLGIALVGLAIAYVAFKPKVQEGGTGGSLDIPAMFGTGSVGGDPIGSSSTYTPVQPSQTILDAMAAAANTKKDVISGGNIWSYAAESKAVQSAISTGGGIYTSSPSKKSGATVALPMLDVGITLPKTTPSISYGGSGWSSISSYTSGANVSSKKSISSSGQTASSVMRSINSGIRRGL